MMPLAGKRPESGQKKTLQSDGALSEKSIPQNGNAPSDRVSGRDAGDFTASAPSAWEAWERAAYAAGAEEEEWMFVLGVLYENSRSGRSTGREGILECARQRQFYLSQLKVRTILGILKEQGLVKGGRGAAAAISLWRGKMRG